MVTASESREQEKARLIHDETRTTVAETLGLVHTLLGDIKVVIEGAEYLHDRPLIFILGAHPVR